MLTSLHITPAQSMEVLREGYMHGSDHEFVDMERDMQGVSFLASTLSSPAYHLPLVRSSVGFRWTNTQMRKKVFYEYGPTARLCINYSRIPKQLSLYRADHEAVITPLSIADALVKCVSEGSRLNLDASHTIFLIKRVKVDDPNLWEF